MLSALTFAGYAMGLARDRIFARTFGAGTELDVYNAAFVLPELVLDVLIMSGLSAAFVPLFTRLRRADAEGPSGQATAGPEGVETADVFGSTILAGSTVVAVLASLVLFVAAPATTAFVAPGFDAHARELYVGLFRLMCVTPIIFAISNTLGEVLVAERRFFFYGLAPVCYNGGIIAGTLLLSGTTGIYGPAYGAVAGALAHLAIRLAGLRGARFRPGRRLALRSASVREFIRLAVPRTLAAPIEPLTFLYFTAAATVFGAGSVSSISFARNFQDVPVSLVGAAFGIAVYPTLAAAHAAGDQSAFRRILRTNLISVGALTVVAAIGLAIVGQTALSLFLGGGAFGPSAVARTAAILAAFAISVPFESVGFLLTRAIYATGNTSIVVVAALVGFVATVAVTALCSPALGLAAIPAGFAAGNASKAALMGGGLGMRLRALGDPAASA